MRKVAECRVVALHQILPAVDILDDSSTSAGLEPASAVLAADAESLPLTGLAVAVLFLTGLALLSGGAALRRGSVAAG